MVILQATAVSWEGPGMACECLIVEADVWNRPVKVLGGQGLSSIAAVIAHPAVTLEVPLCPHDCGLVCEKFWSLLRETGREICCHKGEFLYPPGDVLDRLLGG